MGNFTYTVVQGLSLIHIYVPDWARTAANYANRRGWISGVINVQFDPNGHLNADAWCAMLLRMLGYSDKTGDFEISDACLLYTSRCV